MPSGRAPNGSRVFAMMASPQIMDFLAGQLADVEAGWSVGTFGAIAEFTRDASEVAELRYTGDGISVVTDKGGFRIVRHPGLRLIASESPTTDSWSQRVALCLPQDSCAMSGRKMLAEIGPDGEALRIQDRNGILFDLGLGTLQIDACVRAGDPVVVSALRNCTGKPLFAPGNDAMRILLAANPHRVFLSRVGRAEVFQPIPPPNSKSPDGPHTHILPKLLTHRRTHAATEPLPEGWIPCAHFYPPHPLRDQLGRTRPFRHDCHAAFQILLERYGDPDLVAFKRRVVDAVVSGCEPSTVTVADERFARAILRVTLRQLQALNHSSAALAAWLSACDRDTLADPSDPMEALH
jgi:hypothetical protein